MNRAEKDITVPLLLGNNAAARRKALYFFLRYGIYSHILGTNEGLLDRFCFFASFFRIPNYRNADILQMELSDHISHYPDKRFVLIPTDAHFQSFVKARENSLSREFIISDMKRGVEN